MLIMIVYYWLGYTPLHTGAWCNVGHLISCHTTFIILVMYLRREKYGMPNLMQSFCLAVSPGDPEVANNGSKRLRLYKCERCAMKFMGLALLRQHCREVHGDQKYYKCGVCGKLFSHPSSRNIHLRLHSGEKPYECETCGKRFRVSSHLKDHIRVHTGGFCVYVLDNITCGALGKCEPPPIQGHQPEHNFHRYFLLRIGMHSIAVHDPGLRWEI